MEKYFAMLLFIFCSACSGVKVLEAESTPDANLAQYKTFDFYTLEASGDTVTTLFTDRINMLKEAISNEMVQRGYVRTSSRADLLVNIGVMVDEKVQTRTTDWRTDGAPRYMGQRNYSWKSEEVEVGRYREGTVSVHLVDAFKNKMVWKGAIQGVVPGTAAHAQKNTQKAIHKLFEQFPKGTI